MKNALTGEQLMRTAETELENARKEGLKLKATHDAEMVPFGDRGEFRPKSRGQTYDIPPLNGTYCPDKVDQQGADTVDINKLMSRFEKTGKLEDLIQMGMANQDGQMYGDFTDAPSFQEGLNRVLHAQEQFALLDAGLRNRFENDPAKFLEFMGNPENTEEQYKMGLRVKKEASPEPDATNKDVINAIRENSTASKHKKAPKDEE